jgi:hypothetical protein
MALWPTNQARFWLIPPSSTSSRYSANELHDTGPSYPNMASAAATELLE